MVAVDRVMSVVSHCSILENMIASHGCFEFNNLMIVVSKGSQP